MTPAYYRAHRAEILAKRKVYYQRNKAAIRRKRMTTAYRAYRAAYMQEYRDVEAGL